MSVRIPLMQRPIAATTTTPVVALFGPTLADRSMPWRDPRVFAEAVDAEFDHVTVGEITRRRPAEADAGAGDECDLVLKLDFHVREKNEFTRVRGTAAR